MRDVAVVGFAQRQMAEFDGSPTCVELLVPLLAECYEQTGWSRKDIGFWCSGSSDYLAGRSFSFVSAIDAIGVIPPVNESHVEMDAAWALYEAWIKIQTGEVDTALVFGFGKSSAGTLRRVLALQLDPYTLTPIWPDTVSIAALQARLGLEAGLWDEAAMAEVANRSLTDAEKNEYADPQGRLVRRGAARPPAVRRPAAQARLRAGDRRRRGAGAGRGRPRQRCLRAAGLDQRHRALHRRAPARHPRPEGVALRAARRRGGRRHRRDRGRRAARAVQPPGAHPARASWRSRTTYGSTRRAAR